MFFIRFIVYLFVQLNLNDVISCIKPRYLQLEAEYDSLLYEPKPVLISSVGHRLENELEDAIKDIENESKQEEDDGFEWRDLTDGSFEIELEDAMREDARVPSSNDHSIIDKTDSDDFEDLKFSKDLSDEFETKAKYLILDRVKSGSIPSGIIVQDYSINDKIKLIRLYQSQKHDDANELFKYIAEHIHNQYRNCLVNFGKWLINPQSNEPIFYRNCVPCANAVDLNLQSLFDNKVKHYFVNSCEMGTQWISYISNLEYLTVDLRKHPQLPFVDVIKQNLISNQRLQLHSRVRPVRMSFLFRYVIQGIVKSNRGNVHQGFFHVCNLITDEFGSIWMIDGQIQQVFDLNDVNHIKILNQRYQTDYISLATTGHFRSLKTI